jgi:hypothetical protein
LPAASVARTRYEYEVEAVSPVSLNGVAVGIAICAKFAQPTPWHRSTRYLLIVPPVSVEAVHPRLICVLEAAVAVRFEGAVSVGAAVVAVAMLEYGPKLFAASLARTR